MALLFGERWLPVAPIFAWLGLAGLTQPINSAVGWVFIAKGRTDVLLRWSAYASLTTVVAFVIGLQWSTVTVAAAYAISGYVLRMPQYYYVVASVGPITKRDLAAIQLPMLAAAGLTWMLSPGCSDARRRRGRARRTFVRDVGDPDAACLAALPEGRGVLRESVSLLRRLVGGRRVVGAGR